MVLYCIQHSGYILKGIIHKFKYHPQDEAVFFVDKDATSLCCPSIDKIKYYQMPDPFEISGRFPDSGEETKKYTNQVISDFFKQVELDPMQFSHIYAIYDTNNPFTLYFEMNAIKYMIVEGYFNKIFDYSTDNFFSIWPKYVAYNHLLLDMHLQDGQGENCIKVYMYSDNSALPEDFETPYEIFGYDKTIDNLDQKYKHQLIKAYKADQYEFDAIVVMSSPLITRIWLSLQNKVDLPSKYKIDNEIDLDVFTYFFKTIFDYYYSDIDIILKLHPESPAELEEIFSDFKQIPQYLPLEIFSFIDRKFDVLSPMPSTAEEIFRRNNYKVYVLGTPVRALIDFFGKLHFVFLAFTMINAIGKPARIVTHYLRISQLETFAKWAYKDFEEVKFETLNGESVKYNGFIIANKSEKLADMILDVPMDCLIIVNGDFEASPVFAQQKMIYSIIDISGDEEEEIQRCSWTLLSKSRALLNMVKDFAASYTLEHSQVRIESYPAV